MRKNDLIKLLTELEGNPEVVLWNGMVGDWMPIDSKLIEGELVKRTEQHFLETVRFEKCRDRQDWEYQLPEEEVAQLKKSYRGHDWEDNDFVTDEDLTQKRWKKKRVVYINAKKRGVSTWDRLGTMKY